MIVFEGENSMECRRNVNENYFKKRAYGYFAGTIICFLGGWGAFLLHYESLYYFLFPCSFLSLFLAVLYLVFLRRRFNEGLWKKSIVITSDEIILTDHANHFNAVRSTWKISSVRKAADKGIYYEILVTQQRLICEKNLMISGTPDEFDGIFKDKFIKKKHK